MYSSAAEYQMDNWHGLAALECQLSIWYYIIHMYMHTSSNAMLCKCMLIVIALRLAACPE